MSQQLKPKYGLSTTISLVVGCVIGAGIFFKVDDILHAAEGNLLAGLIGWIIVGFSVISGAIALSYYAQLLPKEGGLLKYTEYRFGEKASFFVGLFYMSIYFPMLITVLFTVAGEFTAILIQEFYNYTPTPIHYSLIGFCIMIILSFVNLRSPIYGGFIQNISTVLKVIPLILIAGFGIAMLINNNVIEENTITYALTDVPKNNSLIGLTVATFIPIAFAFDGWYVATQISGEVKNSKKNLPLALIGGTSVVLLIYIFYYLGLVMDLGGDKISELGNAHIVTYAKIHGGRTGTILMQLAIIISIIGTGNALLIGGLRSPYLLANSNKTRNFFNVTKINKKVSMPKNSAYFMMALISISFVIYYLTNTLTFFKKIEFDLSSLPVTFVYVINLYLYIGLFKLIYNKTISGNKFIKYLVTIVAILGSLIVLYGGITSSNGTLYIAICFVILIIGRIILKKRK